MPVPLTVKFSLLCSGNQFRKIWVFRSSIGKAGSDQSHEQKHEKGGTLKV